MIMVQLIKGERRKAKGSRSLRAKESMESMAPRLQDPVTPRLNSLLPVASRLSIGAIIFEAQLIPQSLKTTFYIRY